MKKSLVFVLCLCLLCGVFAGCSEEEVSRPYAEDPIESYDQVSRIEAGGDTSTEEAAAFEVQYKKYDYRDGNVVILHFKNPTETNYRVSVTAEYKNASGTVLHAETQTYRDIAAGTETHFIFYPGMAFAEFDYSVFAEEFTGECYLSNIKQLEWDMENAKDSFAVWDIYPPAANYPPIDAETLFGLYGYIHYENKNTTEMARTMLAVSFNTAGEILHIEHLGYKLMDPGTQRADSLLAYHEEQFTADQSTWPESFKDGIYVLLVATDVVSKEEYQQIVADSLK